MRAKVPGDCLLGLETINKGPKLLMTIFFLKYFQCFIFFVRSSLFLSLNQGLKIVMYVRRQTANVHLFQCCLPSYIPNLYSTVENSKYAFNKVNIIFCIFDPL